MDVRQTPMGEAQKAGRGRNMLQEEQRLRTRALLTTAGAEIFSANGYAVTGIEAVLIRAGVSRAAFYAQFDGKLALVCAIAEDFIPVWRPVFDGLLALQAPSIAMLEDWARLHLAFHRKHYAICGLLTQVAGLEDRLYQEVARQRDELIALLGTRHAAFAHAATEPDMMLRARLLLEQIDQVCFAVVHNRLPDPRHGAARVIAEQLHAFLQRQEP